jgi:hypothetical protein
VPKSSLIIEVTFYPAYFQLLTAQRDRGGLEADGAPYLVQVGRVWDFNVGLCTDRFHDDLLLVLKFPYDPVYKGVENWEANGSSADAYGVNVRQLVLLLFFDIIERTLCPLASKSDYKSV